MRYFSSLSVDAGSAAAPGYSFGNNPNSGMFGRADDSLGFSVKGVVPFEVGTYGAYAVNNTSIQADSGFVTGVRALTDVEISAWAAVSPRMFRHPQARAVKSAYIAQDIVAAFAAKGLSTLNYNLIELVGGKYHIKLAECLAFEAAYLRSLNANRLNWVDVKSVSFSSAAPLTEVIFDKLDSYNDVIITFDNLGTDGILLLVGQTVNMAASLNGTTFGAAQAVTPGFANANMISGELVILDVRSQIVSVNSIMGTNVADGAVGSANAYPRFIKANSSLKALRFTLSLGGALRTGSMSMRAR